MLRQARERLPKCAFVAGRSRHLAARKSATDLLFANAVFQWVPDHPAVLRRLLQALPEGGVLAVQMPDNTDEPALSLHARGGGRGPVGRDLAPAAAARDDLPSAGGYYDLLRPHCQRISTSGTRSTTTCMAGPEAIVEWFKGSALRPFLAPLDRATCARLSSPNTRRGSPAPIRARFDGKVLLRFPRLFIVAVR